MFYALLTIFLAQRYEIVLAREPIEPLIIAAEVTGYSSTRGQTDDTPFITASNKRVKDGIVANNCLPFGTKVLINNKVYQVEDRMARRMTCRDFDIWFRDTETAKQFGRQELNVEIIN